MECSNCNCIYIYIDENNLCKNNDENCSDFCYFTPCNTRNNVNTVGFDDFDSDVNNRDNENTVIGLLTFIKTGGPTQKPTQRPTQRSIQGIGQGNVGNVDGSISGSTNFDSICNDNNMHVALCNAYIQF